MAYRILIVDDEPALQQLVGEILSGAGYETDSALSCAQAHPSPSSPCIVRCA